MEWTEFSVILRGNRAAMGVERQPSGRFFLYACRYWVHEQQTGMNKVVNLNI
jgi:hypothetical protein